MDSLLANRNLAKEKNNAQIAIDNNILRMAVSARESEFSLPVMVLSGDVNFSQLRPLNIESIVSKEPGYITEVTGIPDGVKNVKIEKHLLIEAPQLPNSLETLNLNGNYIEQINLSNLNKLKVVHLNGNRLKTLSKYELPESLEELYIDNNQIVRLDLDSLNKLRILHCRNNKMMRIENIPSSIVDLQVEEGNPQIILDYAFLPNNIENEETGRAKGTEAEIVESMHDYFRLKSKYEEKEIDTRSDTRKRALSRGLGEKRARKLAREVRPKCVNCKRPVGTVFKIKEDRLLAYCGDAKEPCPLAIEIFKGQFENDDKFADLTAKSLLEVKENIIRNKMDVLFNYITEEETVTKFKDLIEDYNLFSFLHKTDLDIREDKRFNVHKRELIKGKLKLLEDIKGKMNTYMDEYKESDNRDALHSAMDIYIREYMPEVNNLRLMKYSVMEMVIAGTDEDTMVRSLNQSAASIRQLEIFHGEVPKVLKFRIGQGSNLDNEDRREEPSQYKDQEDDNNGEEEVPFTPEPGMVIDDERRYGEE
jgi:Leucine-rich repeat (LRR) protein